MKRNHIFIRHHLETIRSCLDAQGAVTHLLLDLSKADEKLKGQIDNGVASIGSLATRDLVYGEEGITFLSRKNGVPMEVSIPYDVMLGVKDTELFGGYYPLDVMVIMHEGQPILMQVMPDIEAGQEVPKEFQAPKPRPNLQVVK